MLQFTSLECFLKGYIRWTEENIPVDETLFPAYEDISMEHIKKIFVEWKGTADNISNAELIHGGCFNVILSWQIIYT